jgi:hypothetical protein
MIHSKATKLRIFPWNGSAVPEQIDRLQDVSGDQKLNQTKLYEMGRDGKMAVKKDRPSFAYKATQYEYGNLSFFRRLAGMDNPGSGESTIVDLDDLKSSFSEITAYLTDEANTFRGTIWFPKLRVSGFSINIANPDAIVERTWDLVGEDYKIIEAAGVGKYFSYVTATVSSPGDKTVTCTPDPILYAAGDYILRVVRVRAGVATELVEDALAGNDTWSYSNSTKLVTVKTCLAADTIKVFFPTATAYTTLWTDNDSDAAALYANCTEIYLKVGSGSAQKIYRLQSVGIDIKFDRADFSEIGNAEIVSTSVKSKTVTVTLGDTMDDFTIEEILRDTSVYPLIDSRNLSSDISLIVKIFTDSTHSTFSMGYKITDLSPTALNTGDKIEDFKTKSNTLESDNWLATTDETDL